MKYQFLFYNCVEDYILPMVNTPNIVCVEKELFSSSKILKVLHKLHWSKKLNKLINIPFKRIWYPMMFKYTNDSNAKCYVFYGGKYIREDLGIVDYIKRINPENKVIIYFGDLISKRRILNQKELFEKVDLVLSYDMDESKKYNISFVENVYFSPIVPITTVEEFDYDIYFLGFAKDRLESIYKVWEYLVDRNIRCLFIIAGVEVEKRRSGVGLVYVDKPISYKKNLEFVRRSRCILELIQGESSATTLRILEAVCYKRKLISNSPSIRENSLYCSGNMQFFNRPEDISVEFLKSSIEYRAYDEIHTKTPDDLLKKIENLLEEKRKKHVQNICNCTSL